MHLAEWEGFYVIAGTSASVLTGLMFVVITLNSERHLRRSEAVKAFATPTIVHYGCVLLLSAFLTTPGQTARTLGTCVLVTGAIGLFYGIGVVRQAMRQTDYAPELEDWIFHAALPVLSYAVLVIAGVLFFSHGEVSLYFVAAVTLVLLFVGIHNAWDSAVYLSTNIAVRRREPSAEPVAHPTTSTDSASSGADAPRSD